MHLDAGDLGFGDWTAMNSGAVIKHLDQNQLREGRGLFPLICQSLSLNEVRAGTQVGT